MGASLIGNPQIPACLPPLTPMRRETEAAMAMLRHKMGKLMKKRPLHLLLGNAFEGGIEPNLPMGGDRNTGGRPHPEIPPNRYHSTKFGSNLAQKQGDTLF